MSPLLVINGEEGVGPGDRFIAETLLGAGPKPAAGQSSVLSQG